MRKILFFDPKIVEIGLNEAFKDLNLEILKATSSNEAIDFLKSPPVSMVISEMISDGKWLLSEVKGLDPQPPFVFLSSGPVGPSRFFKMGAQCCFPKTEEGLSLLKDFIDLWMKRDELYRSYVWLFFIIGPMKDCWEEGIGPGLPVLCFLLWACSLLSSRTPLWG